MTRLPTAVPKPRKSRKKPRKPIRRSRVRQKAGKPKRFAKRRDYPYLRWIREQPCVVETARPEEVHVLLWYIAEAAHLKTRGAGGSDRENVVPLCRIHHNEQEGKTAAFERKYGVDLRKLAQQYTERYDRERSVG